MSNIRPNVLTEEDMADGKITFMTLSDIKDILLDPTVAVQKEPVVQLASPVLMSWTLVPPEKVTLRMAEAIRGEPPSIPQRQEGRSWLRSIISMHDASILRSLMWPSNTPAAGPELLEMAMQEMVYTLLEAYYTATRTSIHKWVRFPLEIRVRDIAHYRHFKSALAKVDPDGSTAMNVRCDNVLGFERPETAKDPVYALCGKCFKISASHNRCSGCKVC